jgi:hypothetical protein
MKAKFLILIMFSAVATSVPAAFAQYSGGSADGYASSRSDDVLYEGTMPVTTGSELPDVVHNLTINNSGGVTLSKNITVNGLLSVLDGDFNLNGHVITFGPNATLQETPGNIIIGGGGNITVTRTLNDLSAGQNVGNLGLKITTVVPLGETTIARGNVPQQLTPDKLSSSRFFDVAPANNGNLNALVEFHYDESELNGIPEADLALFISHDAPGLTKGANTLPKTLAEPTWEFLGGTVDPEANSVGKGGVPDFSRLAIGRGFVFLAGELVKIDGNEISEGDIHSNGKITFGKGEPGTHTGNLTAVDDIKIEKKNRIAGDAIAGDDLFLLGDATVSGTAADHANVAPLGLPKPSFTAGGNDVTVPKKESRHLAPGSYDDVEIKKKGTLFLTAGDYFINELDTDKGAVLSIDVSAGPVNINVAKELEFDEHTEIVITPAGATNQVAFTALQHKKVDIGEESLILGWLIAPNAEVHFDEKCRFQGSVVAKSITVEEDVIFFSHASTRYLPRPAHLADAEERDATPTVVIDYELAQNYPNPFNPTTTIRFSLKEAGFVSLSIYNLQGQEVRNLLAADMNAGRHEMTWDGKDNRGRPAPSGMYFYRLGVNGFVQTKKMSLVK